MRWVSFAAILAFVGPSFLLAQGPPAPGGVRPGLPGAGAQRPGMPPRDPNDSTRATRTGTATLRGRVVAADSGAPLRRAQIAILAADAGQPVRRVTTTDGEGRYEFRELPAARYAVTVQKAGYVSLQYGQRRPYEAGTPVNVTDGATVERVDVALPKGSVIAVRVTDEFGEPIAGAQVQVQRYQYGPDGQRRLTTATTGVSVPFASTDDRGEYRAYGLMPGEYVIQAAMRSLGALPPSASTDAAEGFSPTYYPGTISANEAQVISVAVGQEVPVQFSMVAARLARITGSVADSQGRPAAGAQVSLRTQIGNTIFGGSAASVSPDGSFAISGVSPGEHTLEVRTSLRRDVPGEAALVPVVVSGADVTGLQIVTGSGATIVGRVVYEGTSPRTAANVPAQPRVLAQPADPTNRMLGFPSIDALANGTIDDEGHFRLTGVSGRIFLTFPVAPGWTLKSIVVDGQDITDEPLDVTGRPVIEGLQITLTDKLTSLTGRVTDTRGQVLTDYVVVVLPAEPREPLVTSRLIRLVRPDTSGRFETRGMRPGRYVAAAIEAIEQGRQFAPEFQQQLRQGARDFTMREGEAITLDLRLTPGL